MLNLQFRHFIFYTILRCKNCYSIGPLSTRVTSIISPVEAFTPTMPRLTLKPEQREFIMNFKFNLIPLLEKYLSSPDAGHSQKLETGIGLTEKSIVILDKTCWILSTHLVLKKRMWLKNILLHYEILEKRVTWILDFNRMQIFAEKCLIP